MLGVPAAYALSRYRLPFAETVKTIVAAPIIVPGIIVGLGLLRYLVIPLNFTVSLALFMAHTALVIPYAVRVVTASLENLRSDMEEAAILLGCTRFGAFVKVVLPNIRGGVLAAFILGSSPALIRYLFHCFSPVQGYERCQLICWPTWKSRTTPLSQPYLRC